MRFLLALVMIVSTSYAHAQDARSMRRCALLPVSDSVGGAMGLKVFEQVEHYLKEGVWCQYQSNSNLLSVFSRYRENLPQHLKTPQVIRVVADKLNVGSIIRIGLTSEINSLVVQLDVLGSGGDDLLYSERTMLNKDDLDLAAQTVRNWLDLYGKLIPYDGKITGILGDQITLDLGKGYPVKVGQDFTVKRFVAMKKHPLLKKVVDWDSKVLANGKIFSLSDDQALGMVKSYKTEQKLQQGDWVRLEAPKEDNSIEPARMTEDNKDAFGKLGLVSAYGSLGTSSIQTSSNGPKRLGGMLFGVNAKAEAWITRNYFGLLEFGRQFGTLRKSSGQLSSRSTDYQRGTFKIGGGWKYLPLGFFYGPQIDLFGGYASHTYKADYSATDGLGEFGINGIFLGAGTNFPVGRQYRGVVRGEFMPFPGFKDSDGVYGSEKNTSWLQLELGVKYQYSSTLTLDGLVEMTSAKSSFKGQVRSVSAQDTALKFGASFNF